MALNLTVAIIVRAAGPALFLLLGVALTALSRGQRDRAILGIFLASLGAALVAGNLGIAGGGPLFFDIASGSSLVAVMAGVGLLVGTARSESRVHASYLFVMALFTITLVGITIATSAVLLPLSGLLAIAPQDSRSAFIVYLYCAIPMTAFLLTLPIAWAFVAMRARTEEMRAWAGLAAGLLVFSALAAGTDILSGRNAIFFLLGPIGFVTILVSAAAWLFVAVKRESLVSRNVALAGLAAALLGMLRHAITGIDSLSDPYGTVGIARLFGWAIITLTVVHARWLDVRFLSRHRAGLAAAALAALFIVAQLAQNFLSAEYGLLVGGVVAGAFLFAASPIQRAIEGMSGARVARTIPAPPDTRHDETYRVAARLAYRDRLFDAQEEIALADLAERLGIGARRATELRHEIEREKGVR